jgi:Mrp family chromosome partitioning ATPase/capsular polysaccharide biosynthesis protein
MVDPIAGPAGPVSGRQPRSDVREAQAQTVDLLRFARILRRRWLLIVGLAVLGAVLGAGSTALHHAKSPTGTYYKSTDTLTTTHDDSSTSTGYRSLSQVAVRVTSGQVPKLVAQKLGGDPQRLVEHITVTVDDSVGTLAITAVAPVPAEADRLASTFGEQLVASLDAEGVQSYQDSTKQLLDKSDQLKQHEVDLDTQIRAAGPNVEDLRAERDATADELRLTLTQIAQHSFDSPQASPVEEFDPPHATEISLADYQDLLQRGIDGDHLTTVTSTDAAAAASSAGPDLSGAGPRGLLGAFLGAFLGLALAVALDAVDRRIRSREELEHALGAPVLSEIPEVDLPADQGVVSVIAPYSRAAEGYRAVRSAVLFELALAERADDAQSAGIVVMVVSGIAAEGKTTTTANLAAAFAETGTSVLAVNGDFRRPTLHKQFGVNDMPGAILESGISGVHVVTSVAVSPQATPAQVVEAQRRLIQATRLHYDVILLDTAPLLSTNDAIDIAPLADLMVVVARYGITKAHHARRTAELLARMRAPVGGAVFLATPNGNDGGSDYYYYGAPEPEVQWRAPGTDTSAPPVVAYVAATETVPLATSDGGGNTNGHHTTGRTGDNGAGANGKGTSTSSADGASPALSWNAAGDPPA